MKYLVITFLTIFYFSSCTTSDTIYEVGDDFLESDIQVRVIDTFAIQAGTFKLDSLITSSTNRILLGNAEVENYGRIYSRSYMQLVTSSYTID
ncbi:hypothetical protein N9V96_01545, partial [Polaribacter sp.]|nr:hypothetical protein [Polaribacter sp.]